MAHGQRATSTKRGGYGALARGTRGHGKDKHTKKAEARERDLRYQEATEETRRAREALDELIAAQKANPAMGETPGAVHARRQRELALERAQVIEDEYAKKDFDEAIESSEEVILTVVPRDKKQAVAHIQRAEVERTYKVFYHEIDTKELPQSGDGKWRFSYQTARIMLKEGYNIKRVIEYTGIGYEDLADIPIDSEGYVVEEETDACSEGE